MTTQISTPQPRVHNIIAIANELGRSRSQDGSISSKTQEKNKKPEKKPTKAGATTTFSKNKEVLTNHQVITSMYSHIKSMSDEERLDTFVTLYGNNSKKNKESTDHKKTTSNKETNGSKTSQDGSDLIKRDGGNVFYIISKFLKADIKGSSDEMIGALKQVAAQRNLYTMLNSHLSSVATSIKTNTKKEVASATTYQNKQNESFWDKLGDFLKSPAGIATLIIGALVIIGSIAATVLTAGAAGPAVVAGDAALAGAVDGGGTAVAAGSADAAAAGTADAAATGTADATTAGATDGAASSTASATGDAAGDTAVDGSADAAADGSADASDADSAGEEEDGDSPTTRQTQSNVEQAQTNEDEASESTEKTESKLEKARNAWRSIKGSRAFRYGIRPLYRGLGVMTVGGGMLYGITKKSNSLGANPEFLKAKGALDVAQTNTEIISNKISNVDSNINQEEQTHISSVISQMQAGGNQIASDISKMNQVESIGQ